MKSLLATAASPDFPATKHFPAEFTHDDEYYMVTRFDRRKVRVLCEWMFRNCRRNTVTPERTETFP